MSSAQAHRPLTVWERCREHLLAEQWMTTTELRAALAQEGSPVDGSEIGHALRSRVKRGAVRRTASLPVRWALSERERAKE